MKYPAQAISFISQPRLLAAVFFILGMVFGVGCGSSPDEPEMPDFKAFTVAANPHMVTAVVVEAEITGVESVVIEYSRDGETWEQTPSFPASSGRYPVVGLVPQTSYTFRLLAAGHTSETRSFVTEKLPPLPDATLSRPPGPQDPIMPGYLLVGYTGTDPNGNYAAVVYDTAGRVVWYRDFGHPILDFQRQPNGNFTVGIAPLTGSPWFNEVDVFGDVVSRYESETAPETGPRELRLYPDGSTLLYGIERPRVDLASFGGESDVEIKQGIVEYRNGGDLFTWSTALGMLPSDGIDPLLGTEVNPYHINALERDTDGNLLISMRNSSQIVKVDVSTGFVMWRLGGKRNQFLFIGDPLFGFHRQHGVRRLQNGNLLIFDNGNGHTPPVSRAVEYQIDETFKTATFVNEYRVPDLFADAMGFAQRLDNGNTVVCYGTARFIREVSPQNRVLWQLHPISIELPYRAMKVKSLY